MKMGTQMLVDVPTWQLGNVVKRKIEKVYENNLRRLLSGVCKPKMIV